MFRPLQSCKVCDDNSVETRPTEFLTGMSHRAFRPGYRVKTNGCIWCTSTVFITGNKSSFSSHNLSLKWIKQKNEEGNVKGACSARGRACCSMHGSEEGEASSDSTPTSSNNLFLALLGFNKKGSY